MSKLQDLNVWGCPAYVLDSSLANGRQIPRWQPRSSRCQYVGSSAPHGHGVPMVLSLDTGKITAQYHVIFDNWFQTIDSNEQATVDFDHPDWYRTFGLHPWQYIPDDHDDAPPDSAPLASIEGAQRVEDLRRLRAAGPSPQPTRPSRPSFVRPEEPPQPAVPVQREKRDRPAQHKAVERVPTQGATRPTTDHRRV